MCKNLALICIGPYLYSDETLTLFLTLALTLTLTLILSLTLTLTLTFNPFLQIRAIFTHKGLTDVRCDAVLARKQADGGNEDDSGARILTRRFCHPMTARTGCWSTCDRVSTSATCFCLLVVGLVDVESRRILLAHILPRFSVRCQCLELIRRY